MVPGFVPSGGEQELALFCGQDAIEKSVGSDLGLACPSATDRFVMNLSVTGLWNILGSRAPYAETDGW